jgi:hypothetical protein
MPGRFSRLTLLIATLGILSPPALRAQVLVFDFSTGTVGTQTSLTGTGRLRRGVTSSVRVVKNFIDLVPDGLISVSGGGSITGAITHGRTRSGTGFIEAKIAVPAGQTLGSTVTLNVGTSDRFPFRVLRKGLLTSVTFSPNPTTLNGGVPFTVNVAGDDLGTGPQIQPVTCHTAAAGARSNTAFATTLTKVTNTTGCGSSNVGPFNFTIRSTTTNEPAVYATSTGTKSFAFGPYVAPVGVACTSVPGIGAPVITRPADGQRIVFGAGAATTQSIAIFWNKRTQPGSLLAPLNEWLVSLPALSGKQSSLISISQPSITTTVVDTVKVASLTVPGTYTVRIRAKNCGATAPTTSITFQLSF